MKKTNNKIWFSLIFTAFVIANILLLQNLYAVTSTSPYENEKLSIYDIELLYHNRINDLFNAKLKLLNDGEKGSGVGKTPDGDECPENNYSTFCLALTASKEYDQFKAALEKRKQFVEMGDTSNLSLEEVSVKGITQINEIDQELERSKTALDSALATYNELRIMYPMHVQYLELIKNLTEYNKKLIKFRETVEVLPGKFIDATTAECK